MAQGLKHYSDGEVIFREGEAGQDTYVIISGGVSLSKDTARGLINIEELSTGAGFGETGVMNGGKRTLTAVAMGDVQLKVIAGEQAARPNVGQQNILAPGKGYGSDAKQGWWERLFGFGSLRSGKIEIRIVPFSGDKGAVHTKTVFEALQHCADVKVRMVSSVGPFTQKNGISKNNIGVCVGAGRKILQRTSGDILIWGEIPSPGKVSGRMSGKVMHLHFVSALANDEDAAGSFNGYDMLPLPFDLDEAWTALLYGVVLAATVPRSQIKARNINTHIEPAIELGATVAQNTPQHFQATERACLQICLAHCVATVARRLDEPDLLGFAMETYHRGLELVTLEEAPITWGLVHKHLGNVQVLTADRLGDPSALEEAQASFQIAVDTIPRRRLPREWAAAQNKLGLVLYKLEYADPSSDISRLNKAIWAFQYAMQVYTRIEAPVRWAEVMNNYAQVAQVIGQQFRDPSMLQKAVSACRSSLEVRRRSRTPLLWAATQNTLGTALFMLGRYSRRVDYLEAAMDAFRMSYSVYSNKGAGHMSRVIMRNLEHVQKLLQELKTETEWYEEPQYEGGDGLQPSGEDGQQWWKDNVVSPSSFSGDEDYDVSSSEIEPARPRKVANVKVYSS